MLTVSVPVVRDLEVAWDRDRAYALVADVPRSTSHFPTLRGLDDLGGGVYRWHLEHIEVGHFRFDLGYTARYACDPVAGTVRWLTVQPIANLRADGSWQVRAAGQGARLHFETTLDVIVPAPRLAHGLIRKAVPPLVERLVGTYVANIAAAMQGRVVG